MPKTAGRIVINLSAGTAQFVADMEKAEVKVRDFGTATRRMGTEAHSSVTGVQAVSGALRVLEGGVTNNLRAAERFTANVLGLGPVLQAAFPVIGAIAFLGILVKMGEEVQKFYAQMRDYPEKMAGSFGQLNSGLHQSNDELALSNARIEQQIGKLEGRRQNTSKIALDEAHVATDHLAESLDHDLASLNKLLEEQKATLTEQFFGRFSDKGLREELGGKTGFGGFRKDIRDTTEAGRAQIETAAGKNDQAGVDKAINDLKTNLQKKFKDMLGVLDQQIANLKPQTVYKYDVTKSEFANSRLAERVPQAKAHLEELEFARANVAEEARAVPLRVESYKDQKKLSLAEASNINAKQERPFEDRMKQMRAQLEGIRTEMQAIGQGEAAEVLAKGFATAAKEIELTNKALEKEHTQLTTPKSSQAEIRERSRVMPGFVGPVQDQESQIRGIALDIAAAEADKKWKEALSSTNDAIEARIESLNLLTAAIGRGYEATKAANVETEVIGKVGPAKYTDEKWLLEHRDELISLRAALGKQYDAANAEQTTRATEALGQQIILEKSLAAVQGQGAQAVRVATLADRLRRIEMDGERDANHQLTDATRNRMLAEIALFAAQQNNTSSSEMAKIAERTGEIKRLTAAVIDGAEAERKAALENKYGEMQRSGATPQVITAQRGQDEAEHQQKIQAAALRTGLAYSDHLNVINQEIAALKSLPPIQQQSAAVVASLANLENERLKTILDQFVALRNLRDENLKLQAELSLKLGGAQDGVRAFFLEMQEQAKQTSAIIEEALNGALDRVSDNLAKLVTGQKTAWARMFQDLGQEVLKSTFKSALQTGLGKLGGALGVGGKADGSKSNPFHVILAGGAIAAIPSAPSAPVTPGTQTDSGGLFGGVLRHLGLSPKIGNVLNGNGGLLGTGGIPGRESAGRPDGSTSNPLGVTLIPGGAGPDGSEGNPFYVITAPGSGFGENQVKQPTGPNGLQTAGGIINDVAGAAISISSGGKKVAGARAAGGPVKRGAEYLVGEKGPEIVRFPQDGHIVDHETTKRILAAPQRYKARADGGDVSAGESYIVGERGAEGFMPNLAADQGSRRTEGNGGDNHYYTIDARGTDPNLVEQRVRIAIVQAHKSAIATSIQGNAERMKRVPG